MNEEKTVLATVELGGLDADHARLIRISDLDTAVVALEDGVLVVTLF